MVMAMLKHMLSHARNAMSVFNVNANQRLDWLHLSASPPRPDRGQPRQFENPFSPTRDSRCGGPDRAGQQCVHQFCSDYTVCIETARRGRHRVRDLVARLVRDSEPVNYHLRTDKVFIADDGSAALSDAELRVLAAPPGQEIMYTCLPWGWAAPAPQ